MANPLLDAAIAYANHGWPVFPCAPGTKIPQIRGGHGHLDATVDVAQIRVWWSRYPNANIGMPTGPKSGVVVVDVDLRSGGDVTLEDLQSRHGRLPDTLTCRSGGGGTHYYFVDDPAFVNGNAKLGPGIDSKGNGGFVLLAPSLHKSGNAYAWLDTDGPDAPDGQQPAPLPEWMKGTIAPRLAPGATGNLNFDSTLVQMKADGSPVAQGNRNGSLTSLVGQWIREGHRTYIELLGLALKWNQTCLPPLAVREVERTVQSVCKTHVRNNPGDTITIVPEETSAPEDAKTQEIGSESADLKPEVVVDAPPAQQATTFPPHLLAVPGFVGEICRWINDTAYKPQPVLTLANALAFFGAVVGRKVRTVSNLRTNLYCLGVGESGCGKDHSRRCIKSICEAVGITEQLLGGEEVSSDTAITAALFEHPSLLFQFDEIGHLLSQANSKYAQTHQRNIAPTFTKLFTSAGTTYLGKAMASKKRQDIDQPNCCLYGTTVPGRLYEGLTPNEIADGFLGRMLVFKSDDADPLERDATFAPVPEPIRLMVSEWFNRRLTASPSAGNLMALRPEPIVVPFDEEATAVVRQFHARCREMKAAHRAERRGMDALWARGVEHASKLALTVACGVDYQTPVITGDVAAWAVGLVDHVTTALVEAVHESVSGSDFERDQLYVYRKIKDAGDQGVTQSELYLATRRFSPRARVEILNQLVLSDMVSKVDRKPLRGPAATVYVVKNNSSRKQ
jgi:hypothetical protein